MFLKAFGLQRDPFMDTADPAFYYETIACANGRRRLTECLVSGRGLAVVVGPIGAGKTTLCNAVQEDVIARSDARVGLLLDPAFSDEAEFLGEAARALGIDVERDSDERTLKEDIKRALLTSVERPAQYILFIDEAQSLPEPLLETLRGLLNFQIDERKLLSLALSGQMELISGLARHPSLEDRVAVWIELGPLAESEAGALLDHRLQCAGFSGSSSPFGPGVAAALWRRSGGLPRRLTVLAREAMEIAAERGARSVDTGDVDAAARRVAPQSHQDLRFEAPQVAASAPKPRWPWSWLGL
jgi:general secretion pathway protein A